MKEHFAILPAGFSPRLSRRNSTSPFARLSVAFSAAALPIALSMAFSAGTFSAAAQGGGRTLERQVNVTREYRPGVGHAVKLPLSPDMTDTVALRPEFDYVISPVPWSAGFSVAPINPVKLDASRYTPIYPFYAKIGGGWPARTMLDLYFTTRGQGDNAAGLYVNHTAQMSGIKNDAGVTIDNKQTFNSAGVWGKYRTGKRAVLDGTLGLDYDVVTRYGQFTIDGASLPPTQDGSAMQHFATPKVSVGFGHDFADLTKVNVRGGVDFALLEDRYDNKETDVKVWAEGAKDFGIQRVGVRAGFESYSGGGNIDKYSNSVPWAEIGYGVITPKFRLEASGRFVSDIFKGAYEKTTPYILPQASIRFDPGGGAVVPFVRLESRLANNGYRALARRNHYMMNDLVLEQELDALDGATAGAARYPFADLYLRSNPRYDLRAGVAGTVADRFSYAVYGGYTLVKRQIYFYHHSGVFENVFAPVQGQRLTYFTIGGEFEARMGNFTTSLAAAYYGSKAKYDSEDTDKAVDMPQFDLSLSISYNYRDRLFVAAGLKVTGPRRFFLSESDYEAPAGGAPGLVQYDYALVEQKTVADVSLEVEYRLKQFLGIFVQGNNLTNSKLYPFSHYPDAGVNAVAGVKLLF